MIASTSNSILLYQFYSAYLDQLYAEQNQPIGQLPPSLIFQTPEKKPIDWEAFFGPEITVTRLSNQDNQQNQLNLFRQHATELQHQLEKPQTESTIQSMRASLALIQKLMLFFEPEQSATEKEQAESVNQQQEVSNSDELSTLYDYTLPPAVFKAVYGLWEMPWLASKHTIEAADFQHLIHYLELSQQQIEAVIQIHREQMECCKTKALHTTHGGIQTDLNTEDKSMLSALDQFIAKETANLPSLTTQPSVDQSVLQVFFQYIADKNAIDQVSSLTFSLHQQQPLNSATSQAVDEILSTIRAGLRDELSLEALLAGIALVVFAANARQEAAALITRLQASAQIDGDSDNNPQHKPQKASAELEWKELAVFGKAIGAGKSGSFGVQHPQQAFLPAGSIQEQRALSESARSSLANFFEHLMKSSKTDKNLKSTDQALQGLSSDITTSDLEDLEGHFLYLTSAQEEFQCCKHYMV